MPPTLLSSLPFPRLARSAILMCAILATAHWQAGCSAVGSFVDQVDVAGQQRDYDKQKGRLIHYMNGLRAKGDPLGDYYYALANSDGWLQDVKEPEAITQLFRDAAAKGSMDAKILLARQKAFGSDRPGKLDIALRANSVEQWNAGLAELKPLLQQQCFVRRLTLDMGVPSVTSYSIAGDIWPKLRDGLYRFGPGGNTVRFIEPNPEGATEWKALDFGCKKPISPRIS